MNEYPQAKLSPHDPEIIAAAQSECPDEIYIYRDGEVWVPVAWALAWLWEHRRPQPFGFAQAKLEGLMFLPDWYQPESIQGADNG